MTTKSRDGNKGRRRRSAWWKGAAGWGVAAAAGMLLFLLVVWYTIGESSSPPEISLDKSKGDPDAPVTVVEYGDFQCPFFRLFATDAERRLDDEYVETGKVRFVFRNMAFIGQESQWAAEAAECANEQGRFWTYYDKLFEEQAGENVGAYSKENLKRFALELELDSEEFNQCLDSEKYAGKVREETEAAREEGVRGTPALLVDGQLVEGGADYEVLRSYIDAALQ